MKKEKEQEDTTILKSQYLLEQTINVKKKNWTRVKVNFSIASLKDLFEKVCWEKKRGL
jgi:hypothetical protein